MAHSERVLLAGFIVFALVSGLFLPASLAVCGWDVDACAESGSFLGQRWRSYASFAPVFLDPPMWLKIINSFDTVLFLPLYYAPSVYALWTGQVDTPWYRLLACVMSGALLFGVALNVTAQALGGPEGTQIHWVISYNAPWVIIPLLLLGRVRRGMSAERAGARGAVQGVKRSAATRAADH